MSLPAPSYAVQVDPFWNNVPVAAIEVVASVAGSPVSESTDQVVIIWHQQSYHDQVAILAALPAIDGSPATDVRAVLEAAGVTPVYTSLPVVFPRPGPGAVPINETDVYYNGSAWAYVYDDSLVP